jgi:hypothetical protein
VGDVKNAVDPVADDQLVLLRLDVDVARAVLGRLEDHRVDEPDKRRVGVLVFGLEVVGLFLLDVFHLPGVGGAHRLGRAREAAQLGEDVVLCRDMELDRLAGGDLQLVEAADVLRVGDRDLEPVAVAGERDRDDAVQHRQRDRPGGLVVDAGDAEVDERQVVLLGDRPRCVERAGELSVDQLLRERVTRHGPVAVGVLHAIADESQLRGVVAVHSPLH